MTSRSIFGRKKQISEAEKMKILSRCCEEMGELKALENSLKEFVDAGQCG